MRARPAYILISLAIALFVAISAGAAGFIIYNDELKAEIERSNKAMHQESDKNILKSEQANRQLIERLERLIADTKKEINSSKSFFEFQKKAAALPPPKSEKLFEKSLEKEVYAEDTDLESISKSALKPSKPKLAIIIDDIAFEKQLARVLGSSLTLNPSVLPPTSAHPNSALYVEDFDNYLVHIPLEAHNFKQEEEHTLRAGDSRERISSTIKEIRKSFPKAIFVNNHTGSRFTEDYESMDMLITELDRFGFVFLDSRTTSMTQAERVAKKRGIPILTRDIFLDNKKDGRYIKKQLKKAVAVAKKRGYAIAIGHPFSHTIDAIEESKGMLEEVELVELSAIYELHLAKENLSK